MKRLRSNGGSSHFSAFFSTAVASLGTALTMVHLMFVALGATCFADFGAYPANLLRKL